MLNDLPAHRGCELLSGEPELWIRCKVVRGISRGGGPSSVDEVQPLLLCQ